MMNVHVTFNTVIEPLFIAPTLYSHFQSHGSASNTCHAFAMCVYLKISVFISMGIRYVSNRKQDINPWLFVK